MISIISIVWDTHIIEIIEIQRNTGLIGGGGWGLGAGVRGLPS